MRSSATSRCAPCRSATRSWATWARGSTRRSARWRRCWSCRSATRPPGWATRRGRRTTRSSRANHRGSSPRSGGWRGPMGLLRVLARAISRSRCPAPARRADGTVAPTGRRSSQPLIVISQAKAKADALDGLERWKKRHPKAAKHIAEDDVLVDGMRGRSSLWYRVRLNLRHVRRRTGRPRRSPTRLRPRREWRR